jgi:hypothetical protein
MQIRDVEQSYSGVFRSDVLRQSQRPDFLDGLLARLHRLLNPERQSAAAPTEAGGQEKRQ